MRERHGCRHLRVICQESLTCSKVFRTFGAWSQHAMHCSSTAARSRMRVTGLKVTKACTVIPRVLGKRRPWSDEAKSQALALRGTPHVEVAVKVGMSSVQVRCLWREVDRKASREAQRKVEAIDRCRVRVDEILRGFRSPMPVPCEAWDSEDIIAAYCEYAKTVPDLEVSTFIRSRVQTGGYVVEELERLSKRILVVTALGAQDDAVSGDTGGKEKTDKGK